MDNPFCGRHFGRCSSRIHRCICFRSCFSSSKGRGRWPNHQMPSAALARSRRGLGLLTVLTLVLMSSCASIPKEQRDPRDPWEGFNRTVFKFNDTVDKAVMKPVTRAYQKITPDFMEKGVSNFFSNLGDIKNSVNNLLQAKLHAAGNDALRFTMNSTLGVVGLFDVASKTGLVKHDEDFGQTLAVWGVKQGPYLVLPFLGPATVRSSAGLVGDYYTYPPTYLSHSMTAYEVTVFRFIDLRSSLLYAEDTLGTQFYDPYTFYRDAYLEHRKILVTDGKNLGHSSDDDLIKELESLD